MTTKPTDALAELDAVIAELRTLERRDEDSIWRPASKSIQNLQSIRTTFTALVEVARPIAHFTTAVRARSGSRGDELIRIECEAGVFVLRVSELRALSSALRSAGQ